MKPGIPWSVKGIDSEAREAAKHAARRSGMTLGEWLNNKILEEAGELAQPARPAPTPARGGDLAAQLGEIAQQLARLTQPAVQPAPPPPPEPEPDIAHDLVARIETTERQAAEAFSALNERIVALGHKLAEPPKLPNLEDSPSYRALEGALRNVVDHIEVSEKKTRDSLKTMQERLGVMAQRAAQAESDAVAQTAPAIGRLESRLSGMAERLERAEAAAQQGIPVVVQSELSRLAERIESVKTSSEVAVQRAQSAAQTAVQRELREIEGRVQQLLQETQGAVRGAAGAGTELQALRGEVEGLAQRFDDLKADAASERDLHALRLAIEQLSARIAQGPDLRPLNELDRKLADLAQRLQQSQEDPRLSSQLGELDQRIYELDQRLGDVLQRTDHGGRAAAALEAQISGIADRITGAEQQLGHLSSMERSVNQLYERIEQTRAWARDVAEDAAARMGERMVQVRPPGQDAELRALEEALASVRSGAAAAERRNQETLEAVHETLEQIVNRLAEMEAQPQPAPYRAPEPAPPGPSKPFAFDPPWSAAPPPAEPAPPPPVEPRIPAFTAPTPAPVTPDFGAEPAADDAQVPRDDFIAAARRAAQAAAQRQIHPVTGGLGLMDKAKQRGLGFKLPRFSLPFSRRKPARPPGGPAYTVKGEGGGSRMLLFASLALLLAASAYTYSSFQDRNERKQPPAQTLESAPKSEAPGAKPPQPRPAEGLSGLPAPGSLSAEPQSRKASAIPNDTLLTGALPTKQDASLASIIAEPGAGSLGGSLDMPPPELGPESLRQAALGGNAVAQFVVASRYLDGKGPEQDFTQAARWYQAAADAGLAPAQYRIATLFERGRGVPKDLTAARLWYERAGERGNVKAMHNAAVIFAGNQAGEPDYVKAAHWFTQAARHGLKDSQFNLAVLYERGLGIEADPGEAMFWYTLAGRQNDADAAAKAQALAVALPRGELEAVKTRLASWRAEPARPEANVVALTDPQWQPDAGKSASAAPPPSPAPAEASASEAGDDIVLRTQELLASLGFDVGKADGRMGARTANAIRLFEVQQGLAVTGRPSPELLAKLEAKRG